MTPKELFNIKDADSDDDDVGYIEDDEDMGLPFDKIVEGKQLSPFLMGQLNVSVVK